MSESHHRRPERMYHGGAPGLRAGDWLKPRAPGDTAHLVDGCAVCAARAAGVPLAEDDLDPALVYVTTNRDYARLYADGYPRGALYRVETDGELIPSPDPVPSWGVPTARVVAVLDALVQVTPAELRRLLRRWS